jgi:acyl-CoA synthetase (AMP-forming)/AMP-acid ligase II
VSPTRLRYNNAGDLLLAGKPPEHVALQMLTGRHTYGELSHAAAAISSHLLRTCGAKGDRVLLMGENSGFWVAAYAGALRAGLVTVPVPAAMPPDQLEYILSETGPRVVFADAASAARNGRLFRRCHIVTDRAVQAIPGALSCRSLGELSAGEADGFGPPAASGGDDLAALMFTSGSTGKPRGVMVSHANIIANTESIIEYLGLTAADRIMTVLPFHYCFGTSLLHTHLSAGGSLVIDPRFMYPEVVLQRMIDTECTGFAGVPSHFQLLLNRSSLRERRFPHLRYVQQAGGHLAPAFVRALRDALPGTRIFVMYGQTEATARLSYLPPEMLDEKLGSIGKGIPGVSLRVLNESGLPVRPGEVGEIVARGANVTHGYWNAPAESAVTFRNGSLYTGDLATVDSDGYIYIAGRSKDFLKCGGKRISCRQLEEQILACDGVLEAAVVPMPDPILGDAVKLFVVPRDRGVFGFEAHLHLFCKGHMPPQLIPREIVVLDALPKNSAGKVLKETLKTAAV